MARFELFSENVTFGYFYKFADFKQKIGFVFLEIRNERKLVEYLFFPPHKNKSYLFCRHNILHDLKLSNCFDKRGIFRNFIKNNLLCLENSQTTFPRRFR